MRAYEHFTRVALVCDTWLKMRGKSRNFVATFNMWVASMRSISHINLLPFLVLQGSCSQNKIPIVSNVTRKYHYVEQINIIKPNKVISLTVIFIMTCAKKHKCHIICNCRECIQTERERAVETLKFYLKVKSEPVASFSSAITIAKFRKLNYKKLVNC